MALERISPLIVDEMFSAVIAPSSTPEKFSARALSSAFLLSRSSSLVLITTCVEPVIFWNWISVVPVASVTTGFTLLSRSASVISSPKSTVVAVPPTKSRLKFIIEPLLCL